jgi:NTP pyrophosphatase (non-canonical NTP hydrolase)
MNNDYLQNTYLPRALDTWAPENIKPLVIGGIDLTAQEGITPAEHYLRLGFSGEWGEVCELLKRVMRDGVIIEHSSFPAHIQNELGDALWYAVVLHHTTEDDYVRTLCSSRMGEIMGIARVCGWTIEEVGERNLAKLADRKARGVISGKGGDR